MMKRIVKTGVICILAVLLLTQGVYASGRQVSDVILNQVQQNGPALTMYVNLYDSSGFPVTGSFTAEQFAVSVDGVGANVDSVQSYDPATQGIHYVFVVDVSRTMIDTMMQSVRSSLCAFVDQMGPNDTVTIITFGETVTELLPESGNKQQIQDTINGIVADQWYTALYEGVIRGAKAATGDRSAVIVITDGKNDLPDNSASPTKEDIFAQIQSAQVPLYCIGLNDNDGVNEASLRELADATGGKDFNGPASAIGGSLDTIYAIVCGAVELHATMTNPEGKTGFNEPSKFQVGFQSERGFIPPSNELMQIVNWTSIPGPEEAATPTPEQTARPKVTPPPAAATAPPVTEAPEPEEEESSGFAVWQLAAGGAALLVVVAVVIFAVTRKKKRSGDKGAQTAPQESGDPTISHVDPYSDEPTMYDGPANRVNQYAAGGAMNGAASDDFVNDGLERTYSFRDRPGTTGFRTDSPAGGGDSDRTAFLGAMGAAGAIEDDNDRTAFLGSVDDDKTVLLDREGQQEDGTFKQQRVLAVVVTERVSDRTPHEPRRLVMKPGEELTFGRNSVANVVVDDKAISRKHMKLIFDGEGLFIADMNSTNGTRLNGERLNADEPRQLVCGDCAVIGTTTLEFDFSAPEYI